jgi:hypothetical protein
MQKEEGRQKRARRSRGSKRRRKEEEEEGFLLFPFEGFPFTRKIPKMCFVF